MAFSIHLRKDIEEFWVIQALDCTHRLHCQVIFTFLSMPLVSVDNLVLYKPYNWFKWVVLQGIYYQSFCLQVIILPQQHLKLLATGRPNKTAVCMNCFSQRNYICLSCSKALCNKSSKYCPSWWRNTRLEHGHLCCPLFEMLPKESRVRQGWPGFKSNT